MSVRTTSSLFCILLLASLAGLCFPASGRAVSYSFGLHPDKERVVFTFPDNLPKYDVVRTGKRSLTVAAPEGMDSVTGGRPDLGGANIVGSVTPKPDGATLGLKTDAFGYVAFTLENPPRLVVDVFPDPLGARWTPRAGADAPQAKAPAPAKKPAPKAKNATRTAPKVNATTPRRAAAPQTNATGNRTAAPSRTNATQANATTPSRAAASNQTESKSMSQRVDRGDDADKDSGNVFRGRVVKGQGVPEVRQKLTTPQAVRRPVASNTTATPEPQVSAAAKTPSQRVEQKANGTGVREKVADFLRDESMPWAVRAKVNRGSKADATPLSAPEDDMSGVRAASDALPQPVAEEPQPEPEVQPEPESPEQPEETVVAEGEVTPDEVNATNGTNATQTPDFEEVMLGAQTAQSMGEYDAALEQLDILTRDTRVPDDMREEALYMKADVLYSKHTGELESHFDEINGAYETAMNSNLDSQRVPTALLKRGVLNLKVGNIPEATAFFNRLRKKYPNDLNVPLTYYYWGDYYFKNKNYQRAADEFQYLVQVYPDSQFVREASLGLARSLKELGYDKQAFQIVDFIEKRWPRYYIEFPPFLQLQGDAAYQVDNFEAAKDYYWSYYNIDPKGDDADIILARLGDIYVKTDKPAAAREVYQKAVTEFPDREGGLISKMRLAEEGIYDAPTVEQMYSIFDKPLNLKPSEIYNEIIADHPESALAPLAHLKRGIWEMWNKKYLDAIASSRAFAEKYPENKLLPRAMDVGLQSFSQFVEPLVREENYPMIIKLWEENDFLRKQREQLSPGARMALALSFWKRGNPERALDIVTPFLKQAQIPEASEMAMSLALSVYLENQAWEKVLETADAVKQWELSPDHRRELRYAEALAHENLGQLDKSRPLWMELAQDRQLDERQRAYALYFMALEAEEKGQLKVAYNNAQEALDTLLRRDEDQSKIRDTLRILVNVTERSGRVPEALKWSQEYEKHIPEGDPSLRALHYRMAGLHKKIGDTKKWREMLGKLADSAPDTLYGRMAASDLKLDSLEQATRQYQPDATTLQ